MENTTQNPKMDWEAKDLSTAFKKFKDHAEFMFCGPLDKKPEAVKCSYLMIWSGEKGRELFSTWDLSDTQKKKLQSYYEKFDEYCKPKTNVVYNRYKFKTKTQAENESFEQFTTELRILIKECSYPAAMQDELIRDHIIFGLKSNDIREKLIREGSDLSLEKCLDIARTHEISQEQSQQMDGACVQAIQRPGRPQNQMQHQRRQQNEPQNQRRQQYQMQNQRRQQNQPQHQRRQQQCDYCGMSHIQGECPAYGIECNYCAKLNHYEKMCRKKKRERQQNVNEVNNPSPDFDGSDSEFVVSTLKHDKILNQAFVKVGIGCSHLKMKIDTGAQVNVIPASHYRSLGIKGPLCSTNSRLTAYGGKPLTVQGHINIPCTYNGITSNADFYIVDAPGSEPLLGLQTSISLGLLNLLLAINTELPLTKDTIMHTYADVFEGIGRLPGECEIRIKDNAIPIVHPPRKVPIAIREKLKSELDRMVTLDIISKVSEPTEWVNSLVTVQKPDGSLRICLDPKDLNNAIIRPHYPSKTIDDIIPSLSGATVFSKFDARSGYWSIALTEQSSFLTTFNTPFGRYRFLRLPFGTKNSNDLFQQKMDECLENLPGVQSLVDDIVVYGTDKASHDRNVHMFMTRCREKGIKLNPGKSVISQDQIPFFGHILSADGLKMDPSKVKAINEMPPPSNRSELETVLGMITYLQRFAPNLSDLTKPLRQLLSKDVEFIWDACQDEAFNKIKTVITQEPGQVLRFFDPKKQVTLQVDSSKSGLGAVLFQDEHPVCFASKSLTQTEINYAQIEKELYAIVFGCKRFHEYVYGRKIVVQTDHKPLLAIFKKNLHSAPPRLQRMLLQLQPYDIDLRFLSGKDIPVADTLSRKYLPQTHPEFAAELDSHVHMIISNMPVTDQKMKQIIDGTSSDPQSSQLMTVILDGWPNDRSQCPKELLEFWNFRDELSVINEVILKGNKILIPKVCRADMLKVIHGSHLGVEKCTQRAREVLFWPNMTTDIRNTVLACPICIEHRNENTKEPMQPSDIPDRPWQIAATDIFHWNNMDYILLVDYYSRYFEVSMIPDTKSSTVINKLKSFFSRHGIVETLISDNARQYTSHDFKVFADTWDFTHKTSSPTYSQSNGLAERTVQTIKAMFTKAKQAGSDPYLAILEYRNSPLLCGKSPAQLLMSRQLRAALPLTSGQLNPQVANQLLVQTRMASNKQRSKEYYDRSAHPLQPLQIGDSVRIRFGRSWKPANVTRKVNNRSYIVKTPDGTQYRRNRRHLLYSKEQAPFLTNQHLQMTSNQQISRNNTLNMPANSNNSAIKPPSESVRNGTDSYTSRSGRSIKPPVKLNL